MQGKQPITQVPFPSTLWLSSEQIVLWCN